MKDSLTGCGLVGAEVETVYGVVNSIATPDDPNLGEGFYQAFAPQGTQPVTARYPNYKDRTESLPCLASMSGVISLCKRAN